LSRGAAAYLASAAAIAWRARILTKPRRSGTVY
jgi:hypothetical protein